MKTKLRKIEIKENLSTNNNIKYKKYLKGQKKEYVLVQELRRRALDRRAVGASQRQLHEQKLRSNRTRFRTRAIQPKDLPHE